MQDHHIIAGLLLGLIVGGLVAVFGSLFDPTTDNRYAKLAGLAVFVLTFLGVSGYVL